MERPLHENDVDILAGLEFPVQHPIEISIGGRILRSTRAMGEHFVRSARINAREKGSALTVLAHSEGVDLFNVTDITPVEVRDVGQAIELILWRWPQQAPASEPAPLPAEALASADASTSTENGSTMTDLTDLQERILSAAYELYTHRAVHEVTAQEVEDAAGVTAAELASVFPSLDELAGECLKRRETEWTIGKVRAGIDARTDHPEERLLAIFDVFDEWFHRDDYEACTFVNVLLEMGRDHPLGKASLTHLAYIRSLVAGLAEQADLREPEEFARSWHILMKGSIISAAEGDGEAAVRAKAMGRDLIKRHRNRSVSTDTGSYLLDPRWALG